ncbi:MAG: hypothetical protein H6739_06995 [Alphaproteobacteria bacterium]|nr:hypothetical protein [Alphaproteobacteria bacterium]
MRLVLPLLMIAGCGIIFVKDDTGTDSGVSNQDSGTEGDTDTDADADTDTDTDSDADTDLGVDCDASYSTAPPAGPDCVTSTISCGDTVYGTTEGGSTIMDEDLYGDAFCFIPYDDYQSSERVYALTVPQNTSVTLTVDTPCAPMSYAMMRWDDASFCPHGTQYSIAECEGDEAGGGGVEHIDVFNAARYLISIDAPEGTTGPFGLRVECESR